MLSVAIPRFDVGSPGIHLAWTPPDMLGVSLGGYDIQRRIAGGRKQFETCVTLTSDQLAQLRAQFELDTTLGRFLYGASSRFALIAGDALIAPLLAMPASVGPVDEQLLAAGPHRLTAQSVNTVIRSRLRPLAGLSMAASHLEVVDRITVELGRPTTAVRFAATARVAAAFAMRAGKVVDVAMPTNTSPLSGTLRGTGLDMVVLYGVALTELLVCAAQPGADDDAAWSGVPFLVRGLTLPIAQADPTLATPQAELAAAESRLIAGETLSSLEFDAASPTLRDGVAHAELGRDSERILLLAAANDQTFTEVSFGGQLGILRTHARWRRILGFGYADLDKSGLVAGETYEYRITGRFDAPSLSDRIYDWHGIPGGTVLPTRFFIRDVAFRFARPPVVLLVPAPPAGAQLAAARRGLAITDPVAVQGWHFTLTDWSLVIDFATPVSKVTLDVAPGHALRYWAGDPWVSGSEPTIPMPPGPLATLTFAQPVTQIRCTGEATVFAVRIPSGAGGTVTVHADTGPIVFASQPAPDPPILLVAINLQSPPTILIGAVTQGTPIPARPEPGFMLLWLPSPHGPIGTWPTDLPGGPPLDSIAYQIEHRDVLGANDYGVWTPIQSGDNLVVGSRNDTPPTVTLSDGADLDAIYAPQSPAPGTTGSVLHLQDIFTVPDPGTGLPRPTPALGSYHQYRIRGVDTVGRASDTWTLSNAARIEKHIPPPLPVGPQPPPDATTSANGVLTLRGSPGPRVRILVTGDVTLSATDLAVLGGHANAIVLQWGWRDSDRDLDSTTREFRVYQCSRPPDIVPGTITSVASIVSGWALAFTTDRMLAPDECAGQWITAGDYPFQIIGHDGGSSVTIRVRAAAVDAAATPAPGPALFARPLAAEHWRPSAWDARAAVVPLTAADTYQHVFYDLLTLTASHATDCVWVGVSAADAESYVSDELPAASSNGGRPGNESSIAICSASGRYHGRPSFVVPPPLGDIPEIVTDEPTGREVLAFFDPSTLLSGALPVGSPIAVDRCVADDLLRIATVSGGHVQLALTDGTSIVMDFPNPGDEAHAIAALDSAHPETLASRYLLYLIGHHPQPDALFARIGRQVDAFGPFSDRLPPKPGRYFYRVRQVDDAGRASLGGAILPVVIRVPSIAPPSPPDRVAYEGMASGVAITLRVNGDPTTSHLLVFHTVTPVNMSVADPASAELVRIPNRRDLFPAHGLRLRAPDGALLAPTVKSLSDPDVTVDAAGNRTVTVPITAAPTDWVTVWAYALSRDGIPSPVRGPFGRYVPRPPGL